MSSEPTVPEVAMEPAAEPAKPRRIGVFGLVAVLALAADLVSKALVVAHIGEDGYVRLLGGALYLVQARNAGAAWSVGTGMTVLLTVIAVVVVAVIVRVARRLRSLAWAIALGLVLGGALGNLVDRLFRAPAPGRGHVVDWIALFAPGSRYYPIFNLADSCIVVGGCLAVLASVLGIDLAGHRATKDHQPDRQHAGG